MLSDLHNAVAKVCPIDGVRQLTDNSYEVMFREEATPEQRSAAQTIVDSWIDPPERRLVWSLEFLDRFRCWPI